MILLCEIHRSGDVLYISNQAGHYGTPVVDYRGDIINEDIEISQELPDGFYGIAQISPITLRLANADNGVDPTWDEIAAEEELRGCWAVLSRDDGKHLITGMITDYTLDLEASITITPKDESLQTLLPAGVVTNDLFPTTAIDIGAPIPICRGYCKNVPLPNIQNDTGGNVYDYLVGYGTVESLWIDHANGRGVKRDGVLVAEAEYTFDDGSGAPTDHGYAGYATIRFSKEQMNFNGEYHHLTADVKGLELGGASADRNFANVIKAILNDATWGLNQSVDAATFAAAAAALPTASYMCDRALYEQRQVRDILNDMLFACHSWLTKGSDNEWEITVDGTGASVADFGENDGYWDNCEVLSCGVTPAESAIKTGYVNYDNGEKQISLACNVGFGIDETHEPQCISEDDTAKKLLSYIYGRSHYADKKISILCGQEAKDVTVGQVVTITAPARDISAVEYRVIRITRELLEYTLECEAYNASIFDDQVIAAPTPQTGTYSTHALQTIDSGNVGGMNITATTIATSDGLVGLSSEITVGTDWRIWAGNVVPGNAPFRVDEDGGMWAMDAHIEGAISAGTIDIGGADVTSFHVDADGNIWSGAAAFADGTFRVSSAGDLIANNASFRGILKAAVFEKDVINAVGGSVAISKGADVLATTMTQLDACDVVIEGNETFAVDDILRIKDGVDDEWMLVTNIAGAPTYVVTRDQAAAYAANNNPAWTKGATVVNYGPADAGLIYMTASEANAPYMSVMTHAGAPWTTISEKVRLGNLNGYAGYVTDIYGLALYEDADNYLLFDPTNGIQISVSAVNAITVKGGAGINIEAGGDIILTPSDANPAVIKWGDVHNFGAAATVGLGLCIWPTTPDQDCFQVGYDPINAVISRYHTIMLRGEHALFMSAVTDADNGSYLELTLNSIHFSSRDSGTEIQAYFSSGYNSFYPISTVNLGISSAMWGQGWFDGYVIALGGIHVGGVADPGEDNLLVDGLVGVGIVPANKLSVETSHTGNYAARIKNTHASGHGAVIYGGEDAASPEQILKLGSYLEATKFVFYSDGTTFGFSPDITKDLGIKTPTPDNYLDWALSDAEKPNLPYKGSWNSKEAESYGVTSERDEVDKFGKDYLKMSIGTTRWAKEARDQINFLKSEIARLEGLISNG